MKVALTYYIIFCYRLVMGVHSSCHTKGSLNALLSLKKEVNTLYI